MSIKIRKEDFKCALCGELLNTEDELSWDAACKPMHFACSNKPRNVAQPKGDSPQQVTPVVRSNATGWISVKDKLPEFEQYKFTPHELRSGKVLVYSKTRGFHFAVLRRRLSNGGTEIYPVEWKYKQNNFIIPDVTHWCVPEKPEV